ncbi:MAG TPA: hypothetical protein PK413_09970, partial [Thermoanaerobaculia bacterium]|nr:hypothetical protein [Thermoanaerobaculia bacterium]
MATPIFKQAGVELKVVVVPVASADPTAAGQATLVQNAVDSKVDGLAVTLVQPEAMKAPVGPAICKRLPPR